MLLRHFIEYRVDKGQSILSSFLITSGCLDHIPTLFTTTESALRNPQWSWKILSDINSINFYIDAYIDSCNIWSYLPRSIYSTYFYIFLHWFLHFLPSFWVNVPEILRWKDLGGGTASSKTAGGGGAGGASASDFAVMDLGLPRFRWWDWRLAISTMSGMTKPKWAKSIIIYIGNE